MPTNRRRRVRKASVLNKSDWGALVVGTGANQRGPGERERLQALWNEHGERLMRENANPWALGEFGQPQPEASNATR